MLREASNLITDWNAMDAPPVPPVRVQIHDETLRDGLQGPSVSQPLLEERLGLLHQMDQIGVDSVDLGMPVSHPNARMHVERMANEIRDCHLSMSAVCAARAVQGDIAEVADVAQKAGVQMWAMAFVGVSPIRMYVEDWTAQRVMANVREAVSFARKEGVRVCIVTEDTTRSPSGSALDVYAAALDAGAERICACDTVGFAVPWGAGALVTQLREGLAARGFPGIGIDWHGHNDRGLAVANSIAAVVAGADRVHATALGIGERAGNCALEQLLVNLHELGWRKGDLTGLPAYCHEVARVCAVPVPAGQPLVGVDAYRTATGVHAAAVRKALALGDNYLAERVYNGVPPSLLGLQQRIEIGPGSGRANILHWLETNGIAADPAVTDALGSAVHDATRLLSDTELMSIVAAARIPQKGEM